MHLPDLKESTHAYLLSLLREILGLINIGKNSLGNNASTVALKGTGEHLARLARNHFEGPPWGQERLTGTPSWDGHTAGAATTPHALGILLVSQVFC